jgi:hypothetical protein
MYARSPKGASDKIRLDHVIAGNPEAPGSLPAYQTYRSRHDSSPYALASGRLPANDESHHCVTEYVQQGQLQRSIRVREDRFGFAKIVLIIGAQVVRLKSAAGVPATLRIGVLEKDGTGTMFVTYSTQNSRFIRRPWNLHC